MYITNVSQNSSPCWLIRTSDVTLLLDCGLDYSPLYQRRFNSKIQPPLFKIPNLDAVCDLSNVDAILVTNYHSFCGLPWLIEANQNNGLEWTGEIYCTKPTVEFARIYLTELRNYCDDIENECKEAKLENASSSATSFGQGSKCVTQNQINSCLEKVQIINFGETLSVFGAAEITPHSSGFSIGACNWLIEINNKTIAYLNDHTSLRTQATKGDTGPMKDSDIMILSGMKACENFSPDKSVHECCRLMTETLKNHGNVLFPVYPSGIVFDLLEIVLDMLSREGLGMTPIYFISPIAKEALAYAQIYPECLSKERQNKASNPEFPFAHDDAIESGKIKIYPYPSSGLSDTFKGPAVFFSGHPTLELGQSRYWANSWCKNVYNKNAIIVTEPGLPMNFFSDRKKFIHYLPIDTRMISFVTKNLIEELKPKELIVSYDLAANHPKLRQGIIIPIELGPAKTYKSQNTKSFKYINVDAALGKQISLQNVEGSEMKVSSLSGILTINDGKCNLNNDTGTEENKNIKPKLWGSLKVNDVMVQLNTDGFKDIEVKGNKIIIPGGHVILDDEKSLIHHTDLVIRNKLIKVIQKALQT